MKNYCIIALLLIINNFSIAQCKQYQPNSLFTINVFLSFTGNFDESERKLLSWDYCLTEISKSNDGQLSFYQYRLDHTASVQRDAYFHDLFVLVKGGSGNAFTFQTSSNKNFATYLANLLKFGFQKTSEDKYKKKIGNNTYYLETERTIHQDGTPNYRIFVYQK